MTLAKKLMLGLGNNQSKPYLEFVSSTPMTIKPIYTNSGVTLQYSLNGASWTNTTSGASTPSANVIYFRGQATGTKSLFTSGSISNAWTFTGATNLEVYGKLDRLIQNALGGNEDILSIRNNCYSSMFRSCTSLTVAPELPATTLATDCYSYMFYSCTSLTTAPELPATTIKPSSYNGMFSGCTSLITAPSLPATILSLYCYQSMFSECTSLTTLPRLSATKVDRYSYTNMFRGCTSLKISTSSTGIYDTPYRIPAIGSGSVDTGALNDMFAGTGGNFKGTPSINTTYYTENTPV